MADLTGQPYLAPDRESARAKTVIAQIERGLNEATLDDELQIHLATSDGFERQRAAKDRDRVIADALSKLVTGDVTPIEAAGKRTKSSRQQRSAS